MVAHPSAQGCQPPCLFRPCRSSRLRRFSPRDPSQVCFTLQPVLRFAPFQTFGIIAPARLRAVRPTPRFSPAAPCSRTPSRAFPSSSAVPRHRGPCLHAVLPGLKAFLVRQVRCRDPALPLDRTRCSPGLRSPSGFSPLAQPARVSSSFLALSFTVTSPGLFSCTCTLSCANAPKDRQAALQRSS